MKEARYAKLRGRIVEKFGSQTMFAEAFGVTLNCVNRKLSGANGFSQQDIKKCMELLDIRPEELYYYFFA